MPMCNPLFPHLSTITRGFYKWKPEKTGWIRVAKYNVIHSLSMDCDTYCIVLYGGFKVKSKNCHHLIEHYQFKVHVHMCTYSNKEFLQLVYNIKATISINHLNFLHSIIKNKKKSIFH